MDIPPFEIRPLQSFTQVEIWPIISGYETWEIYAVDKSESDVQTVINIHLVQLEKPYQANFYEDFTTEECQWYLSLLPGGYSFGAYHHDRLIGFALGEVILQDRLLRVWEFHVMAEFRRMGVGRALMGQVIAKARRDHLPVIMLETQNTNVKAIRFYRSMGFSIGSIDFSPPHYGEPNMIAFYMKQKLEEPRS